MASDTHRRETIYHLSQKIGVSPSTVSAVLNGSWQRRRISAATAEMILSFAEKHNYMPNRAAQGLRKAVSRLVGLMIPSHDGRFFANIAQSFEAEVRKRERCPIVVSAARDPQRERETARTLISYSIEALIVCGATDPDGVHAICQSLGIPHVNVDLPGSEASSVVSDNVHGGKILTSAIAQRLSETGIRPGDVHFFGGLDDVATLDRIRGFRAGLAPYVGPIGEEVVHLTGYSITASQRAFEQFLEQTGRVPPGIFVNGPNNYEGFLRFAASHPDLDLFDVKVGCYDYDPFASFSVFETWMVRQNAEKMIAKAFSLIDEAPQSPSIHYIRPKLMAPRLGAG